MPGIFNTLFQLRLKHAKDPLEDYLTEIFAYCLKSNEPLLKEFLNKFIYNQSYKKSSVLTQQSFVAINSHPSDSKPDMIIQLDDAAIYLENKVASYEGNIQLQRYAEHLDAEIKKDKVLVYITRDHDPKDQNIIFQNCHNPIQFVQIRWYQIFDCLSKYKDLPIVLELLTFMKLKKLSMSNQFTPSDLITLSNFSQVQTMLDETMYGKTSSKF